MSVLVLLCGEIQIMWWRTVSQINQNNRKRGKVSKLNAIVWGTRTQQTSQPRKYEILITATNITKGILTRNKLQMTLLIEHKKKAARIHTRCNIRGEEHIKHTTAARMKQHEEEKQTGIRMERKKRRKQKKKQASTHVNSMSAGWVQSRRGVEDLGICWYTTNISPPVPHSYSRIFTAV